jgi:putative transposase
VCAFVQKKPKALRFGLPQKKWAQHLRASQDYVARSMGLSCVTAGNSHNGIRQQSCRPRSNRPGNSHLRGKLGLKRSGKRPGNGPTEGESPASGETLRFQARTRDKKVALKFLRKAILKHGRLELLVTDKLLSYHAALKEIGPGHSVETGRWLNNREKNSHLAFRRRERAILRFRRVRHLQKFAAVHSSVYIDFNNERHFYSRENFKLNRTAALSEGRQLYTAQVHAFSCKRRLLGTGLTAPFQVVRPSTVLSRPAFGN